MPFKYLEHQADIAIEVWAESLEKLFTEGGRATFEIMTNTNQIKLKEKIYLQVEAPSIPLLFIEWINELICQADLAQMLFAEFEIKEIQNDKHSYFLKGVAKGEKISAQKHTLKTEVKAATYSQLNYKEKNHKYYISCLLDV